VPSSAYCWLTGRRVQFELLQGRASHQRISLAGPEDVTPPHCAGWQWDREVGTGTAAQPAHWCSWRTTASARFVIRIS